MSFTFRPYRRTVALLLAVGTLGTAVSVLRAADSPALAGSATVLPQPKSGTVVINLINRLVARGVLTREDAIELYKQAEQDAAEMRARAVIVDRLPASIAASTLPRKPVETRLPESPVSITPAASASSEREPTVALVAANPPQVAGSMPVVSVTPASSTVASKAEPLESRVSTDAPIMDSPAPTASGKPIIAASTTPAVSATPAATASKAKVVSQADVATEEPVDDDTVRVTYVPEVVKNELREEIKQEVMKQAYEEKWAEPRTFPDWVSRFKFFGDVRLRSDSSFFPRGNDTTGSFPNFNAINSGSPFDVAGAVFSPQLNVNETRNRMRLRARLGAAIDLGDGFTTGLRFATGENNSPVSQDQSFGAASGQGGNFSKYAIWLDRAFLKYEWLSESGVTDVSATAGRGENPFLSTSMLWADDLGFDGAAFQGSTRLFGRFKPFMTLGAFPVYNTDFNFSSIQPAKFKSVDKWLYAAQLGTGLDLAHDINFKISGAYYDFQSIEGRLSTPFTPITSQDAGDTDITRPAFAQKGNSYMTLRDIVPNALNNFGTTNQFQYFGLASAFRDIAIDVRLDYNRFQPVQISLYGEAVNNIAFHKHSVGRRSVNNRGHVTTAEPLGAYEGSGTAWIMGVKFGHAALEKRWDWNLGLNYRYVGSDALVDGFSDSDFGGGGTNLKGYTVFGALALSPRVSLGFRWLSANEIAGPQYKNDILQLDLNGKF